MKQKGQQQQQTAPSLPTTDRREKPNPKPKSSGGDRTGSGGEGVEHLSPLSLLPSAAAPPFTPSAPARERGRAVGGETCKINTAAEAAPADICKVHHPSCPRWPTMRSGRGGCRRWGLASRLIFAKSEATTSMRFPTALLNGFHKRYVTF